MSGYQSMGRAGVILGNLRRFLADLPRLQALLGVHGRVAALARLLAVEGEEPLAASYAVLAVEPAGAARLSADQRRIEYDATLQIVLQPATPLPLDPADDHRRAYDLDLLADDLETYRTWDERVAELEDPVVIEPFTREDAGEPGPLVGALLIPLSCFDA
jgi:hypothetical protein